MPYTIRKVSKNRKLSKKKCYSVKDLTKNKTFSKCTTLKNAKKQVRLLRALKYNKNFNPNLRRKNQTRKNK